MVFSSLTFIFVFFPVVCVVYWILYKLNLEIANVWLFISSISFYALGGGIWQTLLLILCIFFNYAVAIAIWQFKDRNRCIAARVLLTAGIVADVCILCIFKYISVINGWLSDLLVRSTINIALPLGISFYIFQCLSYIIDVSRGETPFYNPLHLGLYISFFPQLIAGPIVRYGYVRKAILDRKVCVNDSLVGMKRFAIGLSKKVLIANILGELAVTVFDYGIGNAMSAGMAWLGAVAFTFQIYYDFSGYFDMAIGLARIFGFCFQENFNYPYTARTVTDFWRRWHISLSTWFRDYVYIPLGGSRCSSLRHIFNLGIVWLLTAMWHGVNATYLVWGMGYFVALSCEKLKVDDLKSRGICVLYRLLTLVWVVLMWVVFRSGSLEYACMMVKSMFSFKNGNVFDHAFVFNLKSYFVPLTAAGLFSFPIFEKVIPNKAEVVVDTVRNVAIVILFFISVAFIMMGSYNPFLYFIF